MKLAQTIKEGLDGLLRLIYPPACVLCGRRLPPGRRLGLCDPCWLSVELVKAPVCETCGRPLNDDERPAGLCFDCRLQPPPLVIRAAALYREPLVSLIYLCKYDFWPTAALQPAELLVERAHALFGSWRPDVVAPVPLHIKRLRWRGFNQSELLARPLAGMWGVPLADGLLRVRDTVPQVRLPDEARRENLRDAFAVDAATALNGRRVLLVDDVTTTGATLAEGARALRAAGAREVAAYVVARPASS
jgi:ComF family protein